MSDVMWKGKQVKKSDFSKLKLNSDGANHLAGKQKLDEFLGEDVQSKSVLKQKTDTEQVFRQRFGEAVPEDAKMTKLVTDSYQALTQKSVGSMEKGKRVKEAKEKLSLRKHLLTEQQKMADERKRRRTLAEGEFTEEELSEGKKLFKTAEDQAALREWLIEDSTTDTPGYLEYNDALFRSEYVDGMLARILHSVQKTRIEDFIDTDDGAFASNYAEKYQKLCRLASADVILKKYSELNENKQSLSDNNLSITEVRAKIKFFQEMKAQYEDRMTLLSSPYYVLLRKADMKEYMGPDGEEKIEAIQDEGLKNYVKHFVKTLGSALAMGKGEDTKARFRAIYTEVASDQRKIDEKTAKEILETIKAAKIQNLGKNKLHSTITKDNRYANKKIAVEDLDPRTQEYIELYDDLTAYFMQRPKMDEKEAEADDLSFVKTMPPATGTHLLEGVGEKEFWELEKNVLIGSVYEKGEIEGRKIEPALLAEVKTMIRTMIRGRRQVEAAAKAGAFVSKIAWDGGGCDFHNKDFLYSEAGDKLASYVIFDGCEELSDLRDQSRELYYTTFQLILYKLSENGYSISQKYDKKAQDDKEVEKELEIWREKMEKHIAEERKKKGEAYNDEQGQLKRWDYPVIKVNGKSFRIFDGAQEEALKFLDQKSYQINGEAGEKLLKLMDEQEKLSKKRFYGKHVYEMEGGFKNLVSIGYRHAYVKQIKEITDQIKELIGYQAPQEQEQQQENAGAEWEQVQSKTYPYQHMQSFDKAVKEVRGNVGRAHGNLGFVIDRLDAVEKLLNQKKNVDFLNHKITTIQNLEELYDECNTYIHLRGITRADREQPRYKSVEAFLPRVKHLIDYYSRMSLEDYENAMRLEGKSVSFKEVMNGDGSALSEKGNESDVKQTEAMARSQSHKELLTLRNGLIYKKDKFGEVLAGAASELCERIGKLSSAFEKEMPVDASGFTEQKVELLSKYREAILACEDYFSNTKDDVKRIGTVKRILGMLRREYQYIARLDESELLKEGRRYGKWGRVFDQTMLSVRENKLNEIKCSFSADKGEVNASREMMDVLGLQNIALFQTTTPVILVRKNGRQEERQKGYANEALELEQDAKKPGYKTLEGAVRLANEYGLDVRYSDNVLRQMSCLRYLDYLMGRTGRTQDDFVYETKIKEVEGQKAVAIERIVSRRESPFNADANLNDPVAAGLINEKNEFLLQYDTTFADRIMATDKDAMVQNLVERGVLKNEEEKAAFLQRYEILQNQFKNDRDTGWRSEKEGGLSENKDFRQNFAETKHLPGYVNPKLLRDREKKEYTDLSDKTQEKNVWVESDGKQIQKVEFAEFANPEPGETVQAFKIRKAKRKVEIIRSYKKVGSRSAYLMKQSKGRLKDQLMQDGTLFEENGSQRFMDTLAKLLSYADYIATSTYNKFEEALVNQNPELAEEGRETRTEKENRLLKEARTSMEELITSYEERLDRNEILSSAEEREYKRLTDYKNLLDESCGGNLKIPENLMERQVIREPQERKLYDLESTEEETGFETVEVAKRKTGEKIAKVTGNAKYKKLVPLKMRDESNSPLFAHEPCVEDVCQGKLGDCYALSAIAGLVEHDPKAIKDMMRDNGDGTVTVRFYRYHLKELKKGQKPEAIYVTVKKEVPITGTDKPEDFYARGSLWVQMLEKAYVISGLHRTVNKGSADVKAVGKMEEGAMTYHSIEAGFSEYFTQTLTGTDVKKNLKMHITLETDVIKKRNSDKGARKKIESAKRKCVTDIKEAEKKGRLIYASTRHDLEAVDGTGQSAGEPVMRGLVGGHAYTVLGIRTIGNEDYVALRNPWGKTIAEHEVNEETGVISITGNKLESTAFLLSVENFITFFYRYSTVKIKEGKKA